jgi:lactoylglutathione lyase
MKIAHIAIWCKDLEQMKLFYEKYFAGKAGKKYINKTKHFESYFIEFESGSRLELMTKPNIAKLPVSTNTQYFGLTHLAYGIGDKDKVEALTNLLRKDGYYIVSELRLTGDGYYESIVLDPEGNIVEICDR